MAAGIVTSDSGSDGTITQPTVTSYYFGQQYLAQNPGSTAEIQDPSTGNWYPYVPGDAHDNGRGNMRVTPAPQAAPGGAGAGNDPWDPNAFSQIVGRPPTQAEIDFYSKDPNWRANVTSAAGGGVGAGGGDTGGGDTAPPPGGGAPPPPPAATGGGGAVGGGGGGLIQEYPGGPFVPPKRPDAPAYTAPTFDQAVSDPGYQFAQQMGQQGVERSAAARGVLNSGGTLQDIAKWNQALATTQYQNVADRSLSAYNTNYKTQVEDPYNAAYTSALDAWNKGYGSWLDRINISKDITTL